MTDVLPELEPIESWADQAEDEEKEKKKPRKPMKPMKPRKLPLRWPTTVEASLPAAGKVARAAASRNDAVSLPAAREAANRSPPNVQVRVQVHEFELQKGGQRDPRRCATAVLHV